MLKCGCEKLRVLGHWPPHSSEEDADMTLEILKMENLKRNNITVCLGKEDSFYMSNETEARMLIWPRFYAELCEDQQHLLVSLELLDEGAFMEQRLQPLLRVVVAELFKRGPPLLLSQPRVLEARSVHDQQGAQGVLTGLQSPEKREYIRKLQWYLQVFACCWWFYCCRLFFTSQTDMANCTITTWIVSRSIRCLLWPQNTQFKSIRRCLLYCCIAVIFNNCF